MASMRDCSNVEIDVVRKSFGGRYMLRDRCYFVPIILQALVQMDAVEGHKQVKD